MVMVKQVVEAHQGRVEIESAVGQGTRVLLRLPIVIP
ncbi:MAG: ATP-binding protein [Thermoflexus sp.]|jgi:signal transduction histidine kinase|nr:ATP-binding protein [Thermoflexus sp.]MDT7883284.1 ATP-binding protein [Thermoflexus sp.]MDT7946734.1 ATP-binding protein [Thermoflexus sp.]